MSLILDTHILLWWLHDMPHRLARDQRLRIAEAEKQHQPVSLSAITLWEIAMLVERRRIAIVNSLDQLLGEIESHAFFRILPLTPRIAAESVRLGEDFHRDPADQIIVATARCHSLTLITADERIRKWGHVNLV